MERFTRLRGQAGFTLIEVMVAALILLISTLTVASLIDLSNRTTVTTRSRVLATNTARELVEAARGINYSGISDATILDALQAADPALADSEPGLPYTIKRRNTLFTIDADTCVMDDGRDGGGAVPRAGDYCADSVAAGTIDPRTPGRPDRIPEDYKRVSVRTTWTQQGKTREVRQTTLVNNPGSAGAPAVLTLKARGLAEPPPQIGPSTSSLTFDATTSSTPARVAWLLDGVSRDLATGSGRNWAFTWDLNSPYVADDGPYLISAEAYDSFSVSGASRSTTIVLNRSQPIAPDGFTGGRNNGRVELEWLANPERDLVGYVVYRFDGAIKTVVCPLQIQTSCFDENPPNLDEVTYRIHAYDTELNGTTLRESPAYTDLKVIRDNRVPYDPETVTVTNNADGTATLRWFRVEPKVDPDTGDSIAFYRIYRDGETFADRYARVDGTGGVMEFLDGNTEGTSHTYWVSAVDTHYGESRLVAAVTAP